MEFFCSGDLFLLYLLIYLIIYISVNSWILTLCFGLESNATLLFISPEIIPQFVTRNCFSWHLYTFDTPPSLISAGFCFVLLACFLTLQVALGSFFLFYVEVLESSISARNSHSFSWRMVLGTKIWALEMLIAVEVSLLLSPLR